MAGMTALVLGLVWAFACSCCVAADIPVQPNFDATKSAGKWYPIQLVMDKGGVNDAKIFGRKAVPLDNRDIDVHVQVLDNGACTTKTIKFLHTDKPGKFTTQAGSTIHIVETDYESYLIHHIETKLQNSLNLEARDPKASDSIKEKFKKVAGSMGFPTDKIINMPSADPCPK